MAHQNRVAPTGEVVISACRGELMGNRGVLHQGETITRQTQAIRWISCVLEFKGQRMPQWAKGQVTPLFFTDEAVALAAGHRPCKRCRRGAYNAFTSAWLVGRPETNVSAGQLDAALEKERLPVGPSRALHQRLWSELPDRCFVQTADGPAVVRGDSLTIWTAEQGYGATIKRPLPGSADVITPPSMVDALVNGYQPMVGQHNVGDLAPPRAAHVIPTTATIPRQPAPLPRSAQLTTKRSRAIECDFRLANGKMFTKKINNWKDETAAQRWADLYLGADRKPLHVDGKRNLAAPLDQPEVRLLAARFV